MNRITWVIYLLFFVLLTGCGELPQEQLPAASKILDSSQQLVTYVGKYNREAVNMDEISPYTLKAVVAIEDYRFYSHMGVDPKGLARAAYQNIRAGKVVEGGSTITQQLAKNLYLTHERTLTRKIKELYYAIQLERHYTKDELLNKYLNVVYFGQGAYGIEVAANTFFNKEAKDLTLAESAWLAGLLKAPSYYSDPKNFAVARKRQLLVLNRMAELNYISEAERDQAEKEQINPNPTQGQNVQKAGYFVAELIKQLDKVLPGGAETLYAGGYEVHTTLDLKMQRAAEEAFSQGLADKPEDLQGALVAIDPSNGHVVALVGGRDYNQSQLNRAVESKRQPGSAFKPFVYAAALEQGLTAASTFFSGPIAIKTASGEYKPENYNRKYAYRPMTIKEAVKISDNVVAVQTINKVQPEAVINLSQRLGIQSKLDPYLSLALGSSGVSPLEMAVAYGAFANSGIVQQPIFYTKVTDRNGVVVVEERSRGTRALSEQQAYIMTDMLKSVLQPGGTAGQLAGILAGRPAAGKTGTTDEYKDAWFVGYTKELAAAVYVGYDQPNKTVGTGGVVAGPIWAQFISKALADVPHQDFLPPPNIVMKDVCLNDGLLASPASTDTIRVAFVAGTEPVAYCTGNYNWSTPEDIEPQNMQMFNPPAPGKRRGLWDMFW